MHIKRTAVMHCIQRGSSLKPGVQVEPAGDWPRGLRAT